MKELTFICNDCSFNCKLTFKNISKYKHSYKGFLDNCLRRNKKTNWEENK